MLVTYMKKIFTLIGLLLVSAPSLSHAEKDVELSWEKAPVYLPGKLFSTTVDKIDVTKPMPVLIYLHGCSGIYGPHDLSWASYIEDQGFIVVLPNSMARPGRISNCDPKLKGGTNAFPEAAKYRQEEITYALSQVMVSPWADKKNIFLMGHSEGGIATAQSPHEEFAGKIISGWTCTNKNNSSHDGIYSPKNQPILAVASINDEWRKGKPVEGRCADKADGRSNFWQIDLEGWTHGTYGYSDARKGVKEFLNQYLTKQPN
jgi:dienelactone hydrolase